MPRYSILDNVMISQNSDDALRSAMDALRRKIAEVSAASPASAGREENTAATHAADNLDPACFSASCAAGDGPVGAKRMRELLQGLNPGQYRAVTHERGHLLVIAGAGSGKTRVLTTRIAYLTEKGKADPSGILAITFTNKAAKEMRERLERMLGPVAKTMWISTFHSACVRILRAEHEDSGYTSSFTIYDAADAQKLMKTVCAEENIDTKRYSPKLLTNRVSALKNEMTDPDTFMQGAAGQDDLILARAYRAYQQRLQAANAMDFDDLIMRTVLLFRSRPETLRRYRQKFRHILVDEYQDTNYAQYRLVQILAGSGNEDPYPELTVVGDADQSIYAFRGATIRNIENFEEDFPNTTTILLEQNYRSTQNILSAANSLIANNPQRRAKNLWTDAGAGEKLTGYAADSESDEAAFVTERIACLCAQHGYRYRDFAVFYRANAQSRVLEEMLMRAGIPYKVVGGTKFYDRKEIKDAIAYLQAVQNPDDTVSLRRIFNEPKRGLGAKAEGLIAHRAAQYGISFGRAISDALTPSAQRGQIEGLGARALRSLKEFTDMLNSARDMAESGCAPETVLDFVLEESGYLAALRESRDPQDEVRADNLAELRAVAADFSALDPQGGLEGFLDRISLVADSDQIPENAGGSGEVVLMTVHTAKGLEFPVVFVTGLEEGTFPHIRSLDDPAELAEERRLAYVALTRARQRLFVSRAASRARWGAPQDLLPSRFLEEIPDGVIDWERRESARETLYGGRHRPSRAQSAYSRTGDFFAEDGFAPPIGGAKKEFVPGKLGVVRENVSSAAERKNSSPQDPCVAVNSPQAATGGLKVGDTVCHKSFGRGKILSFEGVGKSTVAKVKFATGATKRLMLRFAPLEKTDSREDTP